MGCRKCKREFKIGESGLCIKCSNVTCPNCEGEKSFHAKICTACEHILQKHNRQPPKIMNIVLNTLKLAKLKSEYINQLLKYEFVYEKVFTSKSYDKKENYEVFEFTGDGIINSFFKTYVCRRFPLLHCTMGIKLYDQLKKNNVSKKSFSSIADNLGFWPYIRASEAQKQNDKASLLEDVFEAFVGVTAEILDKNYDDGVGYGFVYKLLKNIFDNIPISLEYSEMYDPKTRLKEIFDFYKNLGVLQYKDEARVSTVFRVLNGQRTILGMGKELPQLVERQQEAARQALKLFPNEEAERKRLHDLVIVECGNIVNERAQNIE